MDIPPSPMTLTKTFYKVSDDREEKEKGETCLNPKRDGETCCSVPWRAHRSTSGEDGSRDWHDHCLLRFVLGGSEEFSAVPYRFDVALMSSDVMRIIATAPCHALAARTYVTVHSRNPDFTGNVGS
ncbi:hypothetical protein H072_2284 [Dactylellina haptotyla CBS 200.50]|uniref:Uncharacterized protein n=1 Tax=Dactylellina haptotyla (strain CBS 200.50) TaxID=1284197 RepID=S8AL92_DACHA|nr:hypothetical protein H072_2284 [Dactylellina haptotyla CBS 200.50]